MYRPGKGLSRLLLVTSMLVAVISSLSIAFADDAVDELPKPRNTKDTPEQGPAILPASYPDGLGPALPITLVDTLRLAVLANLDIVQARLTVERAQARYLRAWSIYLPNFSLGSTYVAHDGRIQRTEGTVVEVNRDSLFIGGGPSMSLGLSDAIFLPNEYRSLLSAATIRQATVTNNTLLQVADAYFNVLRARRRVARLDEVLDFLTSEKESELRAGTRGLLPLIKAFVKAETGLPSDQARVEADVVRRMEERVRAMQELRVASAELARILHLPGLYFMPAEDFRWPIPVPGEPWLFQPMEALVTQALRSRPELAENRALLEAAVLRYKNSYWRPILPQLVVNYSYGGFGGGPSAQRTATGSTLLSNSRTIADFGTRGDFDISLVWRLQGMGVGNRAEQWDARVRIQQNQIQQLFLHDQVVTQVVQAVESIRRGYERVAIIRTSMFDEKGKPTGAVYRSLRLNFLRIKGGQGLPLEVLDSTRRLSDVLENYALALTDYDQARFRLMIAMGMPADGLTNPELLPMPTKPPAKVAPGQVPPSPSTAGANSNSDKKEGANDEKKPKDELPDPRKRNKDVDLPKDDVRRSPAPTETTPFPTSPGIGPRLFPPVGSTQKTSTPVGTPVSRVNSPATYTRVLQKSVPTARGTSAAEKLSEPDRPVPGKKFDDGLGSIIVPQPRD